MPPNITAPHASSQTATSTTAPPSTTPTRTRPSTAGPTAPQRTHITAPRPRRAALHSKPDHTRHTPLDDDRTLPFNVRTPDGTSPSTLRTQPLLPAAQPHPARTSTAPTTPPCKFSTTSPLRAHSRLPTHALTARRLPPSRTPLSRADVKTGSTVTIPPANCLSRLLPAPAVFETPLPSSSRSTTSKSPASNRGRRRQPPSSVHGRHRRAAAPLSRCAQRRPSLLPANPASPSRFAPHLNRQEPATASGNGGLGWNGTNYYGAYLHLHRAPRTIPSLSVIVPTVLLRPPPSRINAAALSRRHLAGRYSIPRELQYCPAIPPPTPVRCCRSRAQSVARHSMRPLRARLDTHVSAASGGFLNLTPIYRTNLPNSSRTPTRNPEDRRRSR
ncbi:hypothetical protein C8F04DRAFT_1339983 [Mycena alexandri]|uniref:Uncharacterized protein n=1 Tax=Mycena alexandri TaxID=1745969 RepID=A0AAD6S105_9AGAR|nr:hypothetical protein C8F04DRAFT_1339983 [Mycena alexandri]